MVNWQIWSSKQHARCASSCIVLENWKLLMSLTFNKFIFILSLIKTIFVQQEKWRQIHNCEQWLVIVVDIKWTKWWHKFHLHVSFNSSMMPIEAIVNVTLGPGPLSASFLTVLDLLLVLLQQIVLGCWSASFLTLSWSFAVSKKWNDVGDSPSSNDTPGNFFFYVKAKDLLTLRVKVVNHVRVMDDFFFSRAEESCFSPLWLPIRTFSRTIC